MAFLLFQLFIEQPHHSSFLSRQACEQPGNNCVISEEKLRSKANKTSFCAQHVHTDYQADRYRPEAAVHLVKKRDKL